MDPYNNNNKQYSTPQQYSSSQEYSNPQQHYQHQYAGSSSAPQQHFAPQQQPYAAPPGGMNPYAAPNTYYQPQYQPYAPYPATSIFVNHQNQLPPGALDPSMFLVLNLVGIVTGLTGIHRFYTGDFCMGMLQILLGPVGYLIFTCITLGLGSLIMFFFIGYIMAIIDLVRTNEIVAAATPEEDFEETCVVRDEDWVVMDPNNDRPFPLSTFRIVNNGSQSVRRVTVGLIFSAAMNAESECKLCVSVCVAQQHDQFSTLFPFPDPSFPTNDAFLNHLIHSELCNEEDKTPQPPKVTPARLTLLISLVIFAVAFVIPRFVKVLVLPMASQKEHIQLIQNRVIWRGLLKASDFSKYGSDDMRVVVSGGEWRDFSERDGIVRAINPQTIHCNATMFFGHLLTDDERLTLDARIYGHREDAQEAPLSESNTEETEPVSRVSVTLEGESLPEAEFSEHADSDSSLHFTEDSLVYTKFIQNLSTHSEWHVNDSIFERLRRFWKGNADACFISNLGSTHVLSDYFSRKGWKTPTSTQVDAPFTHAPTYLHLHYTRGEIFAHFLRVHSFSHSFQIRSGSLVDATFFPTQGHLITRHHPQLLFLHNLHQLPFHDDKLTTEILTQLNDAQNRHTVPYVHYHLTHPLTHSQNFYSALHSHIFANVNSISLNPTELYHLYHALLTFARKEEKIENHMWPEIPQSNIVDDEPSVEHVIFAINLIFLLHEEIERVHFYATGFQLIVQRQSSKLWNDSIAQRIAVASSSLEASVISCNFENAAHEIPSQLNQFTLLMDVVDFVVTQRKRFSLFRSQLRSDKLLLLPHSPTVYDVELDSRSVATWKQQEHELELTLAPVLVCKRPSQVTAMARLNHGIVASALTSQLKWLIDKNGL
eukprot:CAMPEP_0117435142 /NCGR_PEP_ID=MMETSP0759-20121206/323_1 /TAXON_ID=63605 /ORGANISM="Percolomonas cosmopolitus, Strain WS" /LENGTH=878 /DNA_ID=CAMNT_0005226669 /DNA_START=96 /DNA_END=2733 /DNA_ORIENTATION=+